MNRGEIWLVDLDPTIGAEMNKTRPALMENTKAGAFRARRPAPAARLRREAPRLAGKLPCP